MRSLLINAVLVVIVLLAAPLVHCRDIDLVRLVDGPSSHEGRVEVFANGAWGTVCDDGFDEEEASVICRMLGYSGALHAYGGAYYGEGRGSIVMDQLQCGGDEKDIFNCSINSTIGTHDCTHKEDAGVECNTYPTINDSPLALPVRLACPYGKPCGNEARRRGPNPGECRSSVHVEGIVQVYYNETWWYLSSDGWNNADVNVVCGQLGYPVAFGTVSNIKRLLPKGTKVTRRARKQFNKELNTVLMKGVLCDGTEGKLEQCHHQNFGLLKNHDGRVATARCGFDQHPSCAGKCQQVSTVHLISCSYFYTYIQL